jgi:hypothetical protein
MLLSNNSWRKGVIDYSRAEENYSIRIERRGKK